MFRCILLQAPWTEDVPLGCMVAPEMHPSVVGEYVADARARRLTLLTLSPLVANECDSGEVFVAVGDRLVPIRKTRNFIARERVYRMGELWIAYCDGKGEESLVEDVDRFPKMREVLEREAEALFYTRFEALEQRVREASSSSARWEFECLGIKYGFDLILRVKGAPEVSVVVNPSGTVRDLTVAGEDVELDSSGWEELPESIRNPLTALRLLVAEVWGEV